MAPYVATGSVAALDHFETVTIGETKVIMRQSEEYGDQASVFAIMLAGHGQQKPDEAHCAHVAEHTVFRNLVKHPDALIDWVLKVDSSGTSPWILCNGWTGVDHTQFNLTVPGECLPEALERLINGMFPEAVDRKVYDTDMDSRLKSELNYMTTHQVSAPLNAFHAHFFQGTPYCQQVFSVPVTQVTPDQVLSFMRREYSSSRLVLVLVGNFDKQVTLETLRQLINDIPSEPRPITPDVKLNLPSLSTVILPVQYPLLMLGFGCDSVTKEDAPLLLAAMHIAVARLASQPPQGFQTSDFMNALLNAAHVEGCFVTYAANPRMELSQSQLEEQARLISQAAKEAFLNLTVTEASEEELSLPPLSVAMPVPEMPQTLTDALERGLPETPGAADIRMTGMESDELASAVRDIAAKYQGNLQYTVLIVKPKNVAGLIIALGVGLAILAIVILTLLSYRKARIRDLP